MDQLQRDFHSTPWDLIDLFDDVDDSLWCWEQLFHQTLSDHLKSRKVKIRTNSLCWMNTEIRKVLNQRFKLFMQAKNAPKDSPKWRDYKRMRNRCTSLIRKAKSEYWKNEFEKSSNSKTFWRTVKKFKGVAKENYIGTLNINGEAIINPKDKAEAMNQFLANIGKELALKLPSQENNPSHIYKVTPTVSEIKADSDLFIKSFQSAVKLGKACGPDNILPKDLRLCEESTVHGLFKVFRKSAETGKFPQEWKNAKVTCIYKKGSKKDCSNYRPISLLSIPSKVIEQYVCSILTEHLQTHNILSSHQWGFRKQHSTEDVLLTMTENWYRATNEGKVVAALFIDLKKAFDSVSHNILLKKLAAAGVSGDLLEYITSYLSGRTQCTKVNDVTSQKTNIDYGVPQGSLLGPTLFSIDVNDMPEVSDTTDDSEIEMFADDTTTYVIGNNVDEAVSKLQEIANNLFDYASRNSLTIHPGKCQLMIISRTNFIGPL